MKYQIIKTYDCVETTCGELVRKLEKSGRDSISEYVDPAHPADVDRICDDWSQIKAQSPFKKLYLLIEIESKGGVI